MTDQSRTPQTDALYKSIALTMTDPVQALDEMTEHAETLELEAADLRVHLSVSERDLADAVKEIVDLRERLAKAQKIAHDWGQGVTDAEMAARLLHRIFPIDGEGEDHGNG